MPKGKAASNGRSRPVARTTPTSKGRGGHARGAQANSRSKSVQSRAASTTARQSATRLEERRQERSREAVALLWALTSSVILLVGYTRLFGPVSSAFHLALLSVLGKVAYIGLLGGIVFGIAVLAKARFLAGTRGIFLHILIIGGLSSAIAAVASFGTSDLFTTHALRHGGGVVGSVVVDGVGALLGVVGTEIFLGVIVLVVLAHLLGARLENVAQTLSGLLSDAFRPTARGPMVDPHVDGAPLERDGDLVGGRGPSRPRGRTSVPDEAVEVGLVESVALSEDLILNGNEERQAELAEGTEAESEAIPEHPTVDGFSEVQWKLPGRGLLHRGARAKLNKGELLEMGAILQSSLAKHGVQVKISGMTVGPTVTRYELELGEGIKVARILALQRDIAYAMAATDVRILAPIPGKSAIGIEVPNRTRETVTLGDVMAAPEMFAADHPLQVPLGQDISGAAVVANLAEMPHVLIAGSTGSGKSSALNSILTSILMRSTPEEVRLILIDPKRVELGQYNRLPHLLTAVVVDPKKAANALAWAVKEMENRYDLLAGYGVRDITGFNAMAREAHRMRQEGIFDPSPDPEEEAAAARLSPLSYILVVVDELNDLMMVAARDVEDSICRIAQKARAVGIHLIIATQRPSVDVITGVIKANVPSRMAFSVASLADSRVILDNPGAEKLVGKGDMLLVTASSSHPRRIQAPWVEESEVRSVVAFWRRQSGPSYLEGVEGEAQGVGASGMSDPSSEDEFFGAAARLVVASQMGSTSMLQRKLKVGFARAGRIMDLLEQAGIVGPSEGSKPREVLVKPEELEELNF